MLEATSGRSPPNDQYSESPDSIPALKLGNKKGPFGFKTTPVVRKTIQGITTFQQNLLQVRQSTQETNALLALLKDQLRLLVAERESFCSGHKDQKFIVIKGADYDVGGSIRSALEKGRTPSDEKKDTQLPPPRPEEPSSKEERPVLTHENTSPSLANISLFLSKIRNPTTSKTQYQNLNELDSK